MTVHKATPLGWVKIEPEPVPEDDPRVQLATFVADAAWLNALEDRSTTMAQKMRLVVRTVLAHLDEVAEMDAESGQPGQPPAGQ